MPTGDSIAGETILFGGGPRKNNIFHMSSCDEFLLKPTRIQKEENKTRKTKTANGGNTCTCHGAAAIAQVFSRNMRC